MVLVGLMDYDFVTDNIVAAWKGGNVPAQIPEMFSTKMAQLPNAKAIVEWQRLCYELCTRVAIGDIVPSNVASFLVTLKLANNGLETIADSIWTVGLQIQEGDSFKSKEGSKQWAALGELVKQWVKQGGDEVRAVMERLLDMELLYEADVVASIESVDKKLKKINTDNVYRQQKYNLLREETEGYAKMVVLLGTLTLSEVSSGLSSMRSLIGFFDLDPNRVLSLCLDAYESDPTNKAFPVVLANFKKSYLPQLLGFKLQHFKDLPTPKSLFVLTANMLEEGFVSLDDIIPHLSPSLESIAELDEQRSQAMKKEIKDIGFVNLNESSAKPATVVIPSYDIAGLSEVTVARLGENTDRVNQVLGVLEHLVLIGSWTHASTIVRRLEEAQCYHINSHPPLRQAMCLYMHAVIDPIYQSVSPRGLGLHLTKPVSKDLPTLPCGQPLQCFEELAETRFLEPLRLLGSGLSSDLLLFAKLCRVMKKAIQTPALKTIVYDMLSSSILLCCSMIETNPGLVMEVWEVLVEIPVGIRCQLYENWLSGNSAHERTYGPVGGFGSESRPRSLEVVKAEAEANQTMKQLLKRISNDKKKLKQDQRAVARVAHSCPLVVADRLLSIAVSYDNQIAPLVECVAFFSAFSLDVTSYMMVRLLKNDRMGAGKMNSKFQGAVSDWFRNMSTFIGAFYLQNPSVEISMLLGYVVEQLNHGSTEELVILREVLARVGGIEHMDQVNDEQIESFAGGDMLRRETLGSLRQAPKSRTQKHLREALLSSAGLPLLVLTAQMRSVVMFHGEETELKLVGDVVDRCMGVLSQLVEFMGRKKESYANMLPSFGKLCSAGMCLEPSIAFMIARPVIRAAFNIKEVPNVAKWPLVRDQRSQSKMLVGESAVKDVKPDAVSTWSMQSPVFIQELLDTMPSDMWEYMSLTLFTCFWGLSLQDIHLPLEVYTTKMNDLKKQSEKARKEAGKKEAKLLDKRYDELKAELSIQETVVQNTCTMLQENKHSLFSELEVVKGFVDRKQTEDVKEDSNKDNSSNLKGKAIDQRLQQAFVHRCLLPRLMLSEEDALYCARFLLQLHSMDTPAFSSFNNLDRVLKTAIGTVFCISEREATNLGIFLQHVWEPLVKWVGNKGMFKKEAESKCGFSLILFNPDGRKPTHGQFGGVFHTWHGRMVDTLMRCLESSSKFEQRAGLNVLVKVVKVFPNYQSGYTLFLEKLAQLSVKEGTGPPSDINTVAMTLRAQLVKREKSIWDDPKSKKEKKEEKSKALEVSESKADNESKDKSAAPRAPIVAKFTSNEEKSKVRERGSSKPRKRDRDRDGIDEKPEKLPRDSDKMREASDSRKRDRAEEGKDDGRRGRDSARDTTPPQVEKRIRGEPSPPPHDRISPPANPDRVNMNRRGGNDGGKGGGGGGKGKGGYGGRGGAFRSSRNGRY